jgi:hypothetical protein
MSIDLTTDPLVSKAKSATDELLQSDVSQLYTTLQMRRELIASDPAAAGDFGVDATHAAADMGPDALAALREFGARYFASVSEQVYGLICGSDADDAGLRNKLLSVFTDKSTFAALLAGIIVTQIGLAPALAAVVAALVVKLFAAPAYSIMCDMWGRALKPATA